MSRGRKPSGVSSFDRRPRIMLQTCFATRLQALFRRRPIIWEMTAMPFRPDLNAGDTNLRLTEDFRERNDSLIGRAGESDTDKLICEFIPVEVSPLPITERAKPQGSTED